MTKTAKCVKNIKCNKCLDVCQNKYNPKKRDKLNYYVSQNLWECRNRCIDKFYPRKKRSKNKKIYKRKSKKPLSRKCRSLSCLKK